LTIATAFPDPATLATDIEVAAVVAALLTGTLSGSDTTHAPTVKATYDALALKANLTNPAFVSVGLPKKTPVNATGTTLTLPVADLAILEAGDTIEFEEVTCTKATAPEAGEFNSAAELAALLNALEGWTGAENAGVVTATSDALGVAQNGKAATITHRGTSTSTGSAVTKAWGVLSEAELAQLALGDMVTFDGATFTKAADTSVPANTFADTAGLISCLDAMTDWTAAITNEVDIKIEAAENGTEYNEKICNLIYVRTSAGAANGTVGVANEICADDSYLYHCIGANTITGANWRRIARGTVYY
jgi:Cu/Ag efflux protein CusF